MSSGGPYQATVVVGGARVLARRTGQTTVEGPCLVPAATILSAGDSVLVDYVAGSNQMVVLAKF